MKAYKHLRIMRNSRHTLAQWQKFMRLFRFNKPNPVLGSKVDKLFGFDSAQKNKAIN